MALIADRILLAPGDAHLTLEPTPSGDDRPPHPCPGQQRLPAVGRSDAGAAAGAVYGAGALGVVLTGMGRDGVEGAARLVACGGSVIAQDEASCAVWGMPRRSSRPASPAPCCRRTRSPGASRLAPWRGGVQISDSSSRILAGLLEARTGQQLTMSRRWRIETALASLLRERGIATLDELITILVMGKEPNLSQQVVEALLNNETYFFRDRIAVRPA